MEMIEQKFKISLYALMENMMQKAAVQPATDSKSTAAQVSKSKAKEIAPSDSRTKEMATAKTKAEMPKSDAIEGLEMGDASVSDLKQGDEESPRSALKTVSKPDVKYATGSSSDSKGLGLHPDDSTQSISNKWQSKKMGQVNARQASAVDSTLPENGGYKQHGSASNSQPRQKDERSHPTLPPVSKPFLDENIVIGVALDGSKRTLPLEGLASPSTSAELKELTARRSGNGSPGSEKDKRYGQTSCLASSTPVD